MYQVFIEALHQHLKTTIPHTRFAEMETKLGEIDRARAIYSHASQMCDPRVTVDFWQVKTLGNRI